MEFNTGDKAFNYKIYTRESVEMFAELSEDKNPVHLDYEYAAQTIFKKPIVHGMFVASQISNLIANKLPGPGSIYKSQSLSFKRPVYYGDKIKCEAEVILIVPEKKILELKTICSNEYGDIVIEGTAVIKLI